MKRARSLPLALAGFWPIFLGIVHGAPAPADEPPAKPAGRAGAERPYRREVVTLDRKSIRTTLHLVTSPTPRKRRPVILMLGSIEEGSPPDWSRNLLTEGYMLAAFRADHPPDPDPARRPQWLVFDPRFAHSYVLASMRATDDGRAVIDYLTSRDDVHPRKIGWIGSSSTGIPALAAAAHEPRLAAIVTFVSTGALGSWFDTWKANGLWKSKETGLWPETRQLLAGHDPILHASGLFPKAVLMVNGGEDKVVDPASARAFAAAARPSYRTDPDRLRLVVYEGFGHNLPLDLVAMHAEHWFRLYLDPDRDPPGSPAIPSDTRSQAGRTQLNATEHRRIIGADEPR